MSRAGLRDRLSKALGVERVGDRLWERLNELGNVAAVECGDEGSFDDLVNEARSYLDIGLEAMAGRKRPPGRPPKAQVAELQPSLSHESKARLEALRGYYSALRATPTGPLSPRVRLRRSAGTVSNSLTIELEVPAWLPAEEVTRLYREAQAEALRDRDNAPIEPKTLRVFQFCLPHMILPGSAEDAERERAKAKFEKRGPRPIDFLADDKPRRPWSWQRLMDAWNAEHPNPEDQDRIETYSGFRRAYFRAKAALVRPTLPWPKARTETVTLSDGTRRTYGGVATDAI